MDGQTFDITVMTNARVASIPDDAPPEVVAGALFKAGFDMSQPIYNAFAAAKCDSCDDLHDTGHILYIQLITDHGWSAALPTVH